MLRRVAFANGSSWMRRHSVAAAGGYVAAVAGVANAVLGLVDVDDDAAAAAGAAGAADADVDVEVADVVAAAGIVAVAVA